MEKNIYKVWLVRAYAVAAFLLLLIPVIIVLTRKGEGNHIYENEFVDISDQWSITENGEYVSCDDFGKLMDADTGVLSVYYQLPDVISDNCIMYRSKDVYTSVYVDDELIYETKYYESPLYNKSPGNIWNTIEVKDDYAGKSLRMEITMAYDTNSVCVDSIRMGDRMNVAIGFAMSKWGEICISIAMIVIGCMLALMNIYSLFDKSVTKTGSFHLAMYAIVIGMWCFIETNVLQIYMKDPRLLQLIDNMCMFVGTLPMIFYLDSFYNLLKKRIIRIFCWLDVALLTFCFVVQVTDKSDFHSWIFMAWIFFGISAVIIVISCGIQLFKKLRAKKLQFANVMHMVGFLLVILSGIAPSIMYMDTDTLDRAGQIRIGVFLFIICSAIGNQIQSYQKMSKAIKYDLVKNLAYQDGLTGLNNRTSYLEQLIDYEENEVNKLGIVFLDINNLKFVNDKYGHEMGDNYIIAVANVISDSFGAYGNTYRIGGDEFCVFIEGIDIQSAYNNAKTRFEELQEIKNKKLPDEVSVRIAHGYKLYSSDCGKTLRQVIKEADEEMYTNKMKMKEA